jgi:hypothetical protein
MKLEDVDRLVIWVLLIGCLLGFILGLAVS